MNITDWFNDDRKYAIALSGAAAIYALIEVVRTGSYFDSGFVHPLLIGATLSAVFCVGLLLRQEWSRWIGMLLVVLAGMLIAWHAYLHGTTLIRVGLLLFAIFWIRSIWRMSITHAQEMQELVGYPDFVDRLNEHAARVAEELGERKSWTVLILFREPIQLDATRLAEAAERAFGESFAVIKKELDPVDASFLPSDHPEPAVAGAGDGSTFVCHVPPQLLGVYVGPAEHPELLDNPDHELVDDCEACIEVEILPHLENMRTTEGGYAFSGKLAAELLGDRCAGVCFPDDGRFVPMSVELRDALQSPDPVAALPM